MPKRTSLLFVFAAIAASLLLLAPIATASDIHKEGYCVMRDNCGSKRTFGKQLPCPFNQPALEVLLHPPF
ncbi:hypothetical protein F5H01DRAFT_346027 [Linnemannia elongata]|nr:hypothetical protein F5H01DRAFT_346027 [Linnemannia elongata]